MLHVILLIRYIYVRGYFFEKNKPLNEDYMEKGFSNMKGGKTKKKY